MATFLNVMGELLVNFLIKKFMFLNCHVLNNYSKQPPSLIATARPTKKIQKNQLVKYTNYCIIKKSVAN